MYELPQSLLVANPMNRYLINSPMLPSLVPDPDGGYTFRIQNESPGMDKELQLAARAQGSVRTGAAAVLAETRRAERRLEGAAAGEDLVPEARAAAAQVALELRRQRIAVVPTQLRDAAGGATAARSRAARSARRSTALYAQHGELRERIADGDGELRRFVNVYLKGEDIRFLDGLETAGGRRRRGHDPPGGGGRMMRIDEQLARRRARSSRSSSCRRARSRPSWRSGARSRSWRRSSPRSSR